MTIYITATSRELKSRIASLLLACEFDVCIYAVIRMLRCALLCIDLYHRDLSWAKIAHSIVVGLVRLRLMVPRRKSFVEVLL